MSNPTDHRRFGSLEVHQFACLSDNYGFLVHDAVSGETAAIDSPDSAEILRQCQIKGWRLTQVWNTHHHADHTGGNLALQKAGATIIGPAAEARRIPGIAHSVAQGDLVSLGDMAARVIDTPAHTAGHIAFHFENERVLFVGDTLFVLGCGRLFEGTAQMMWAAMQKFLSLPDETVVYCAHEYTLSNARFAATIETDNPALTAFIQTAKTARAAGLPTVPTTIGAQRAANPFMRADQDSVARALGLKGAPAWEVLGELRRRKDNFAG